MGSFTFGDAAVAIAPTTNIVLERLPLVRGDREQFRLHRVVTYFDDVSQRSYSAPPDDTFETDLASVPQLFTWLVPKSGRHLPAALVHDQLVDDDTVDRHVADRIFRDAMGDLEVGLLRRWLMWTAVSIKTIQKRGSWALRAGAFGSLALIAVLGALATASLFTDRTLVPWMGSRGLVAEIVYGLAGAVVIPIVAGTLLWAPIRIAGVIAGLALAVLLHVVVLTALVYGMYTLIERWPRPVQGLIGMAIAALSTALFAYGLVTALN